MPGDANWKSLFQLEYQQLYEEGYPVGESKKPGWPSPYLSFLDETKKESELSEQDWEKGYANLWQVRQQRLRADFPFIEPNDYESIITDAVNPPSLQALDDTEYAERVKGAWYARCAGVVLGKPFEMDLDRLTIKKYLESLNAYPLADWVPARSEKLEMELRQDCLPSTRGHIQYVQPDDDVHYTILALLLAEKKGLDFSVMDVGENLLDNIPYHWLWSATRQAYYHLVNLDENSPLDEQMAQIPTKLNPWRESLNGAIRADFWGYISPGDPRRGARLAHRAVSFNTVKNGIYGAMFSAGCISAALSKAPTLETILQGGLSVIPQKSRLAAVVEDVTEWYARDKEWIPVCDKIYEKYVQLNFSECLKNMAIVVLSLLEGQLDFSRTITTAVMCGQDTDCTSGTAASIVGAALGFERLESRWVLPLNDHVKTVIADFGEGTISELVRRTIEVRHRTTSGLQKGDIN
jgi:hypothetical protein